MAAIFGWSAASNVQASVNPELHMKQLANFIAEYERNQKFVDIRKFGVLHELHDEPDPH